MPFDVHLMISDPDKYAPLFVTPQTEFITVHAEACTHLHRTLQSIRALGVKAGVALNPATSLSAVEYVADLADLILVMSVNPGFGGQSFIPSALEKVQRLADLRAEKGYTFEIEIDGGVGCRRGYRRGGQRGIRRGGCGTESERARRTDGMRLSYERKEMRQICADFVSACRICRRAGLIDKQ